MPGILLYCNGMKPKFKIKLQYDKKNNIWAAIAIILAVVMYVTIDFSIVLPLIFPPGRATITIVSSCVNRRCGQTGSSPTRCRESRPGAPGAASGLPCPETLPPQSAEANLCRVCPLQHSEWRGFLRPRNSGGTVERC